MVPFRRNETKLIDEKTVFGYLKLGEQANSRVRGGQFSKGKLHRKETYFGPFPILVDLWIGRGAKLQHYTLT